MNGRDSTSDQSDAPYLSKKVVINGQTVTLYSQNGFTWLSSPDQIPEVMARLENTRVLLNDPKGEGAAPAVAPPPAAAKPTAARYRMRGPKPRPILQPDGTLAPVVERDPISATETTVEISSTPAGGASITIVRNRDRESEELPSPSSAKRKQEKGKLQMVKGELSRSGKDVHNKLTLAPNASKKTEKSTDSKGTQRTAAAAKSSSMSAKPKTAKPTGKSPGKSLKVKKAVAHSKVQKVAKRPKKKR